MEETFFDLIFSRIPTANLWVTYPTHFNINPISVSGYIARCGEVSVISIIRLFKPGEITNRVLILMDKSHQLDFFMCFDLLCVFMLTISRVLSGWLRADWLFFSFSCWLRIVNLIIQIIEYA